MTPRANQATIPPEERKILEAGLARLVARLSSDADRLEYAVRRTAVVLSSRSPGATSRYPIARFRYGSGSWSLDWRRASERWSELSRSADVRDLIRELEVDPWGTFWG
jgi:hypothetical protein